MTIAVNEARLMGELEYLAGLTDCVAAVNPAWPEPQRAVTRIVFTRRDLEARAWLKGLAVEAGFGVREDAVGNMFVRWEGAEAGLAAVATGSHTDAIPFAGMFDGTVGVLGGLEAMRALREAGFRPRRSLELVMLTSEEPTRFGIGCLGSRLLGGVLSPEAADGMPDRLAETDPEAAAGGTLRTVREAAGFGGSLAEVRLRAGAYAAWLELHIEQGPLLERDGEGLGSVTAGVVTHIAGPAAYRFVVEGVGGHAGALLMPDRRDALCAAAEVVLRIEAAVNAANKRAGAVDTVGTVGKLDVFPGAVNAVPSRVVFGLDLRDTDPERREAVMVAVRRAAAEVSARRGVTIHEELVNADDPAVCDAALVELLAREAAAEGARVRRMVSRAYHDTSFMARVAPVAMLFVPCRGGVSHRADEWASAGAIGLGTRVLARAMAALAG